MARQGRFGRLPRRAPDLTGALVSMMREYWNMQENIMVSSWKDGGEVDGKQVTDEALLKFWIDRRDSVQKDDPLWDYYDQQHDQYKFSIDESKVQLQYAQHKMSARHVAEWYKGQAGQFSQNSEMWRTVMGQAAKFLDAAKAQSRASTQEARQKAYTRLRTESAKNYSYPTTIVMSALTVALQGYGILVGPQNQIQMTPEGNISGAPGGEGLTSLSVQGDVERWDEVLAALNTPGSKYYDYFAGEIDKAKRNGLDISAPFDQTDIDALFQRQMDGIDHDIALAKRFKDVANKSDLPNLYGQKQDVLTQWQFMRTQDEAAIYVANRKNLNDVLGDASADPFAQMKAITDYYGQNDQLMQRLQPPGQQSQNPLFSSLLLGENRSMLGDPGGFATTVWEGGLQSPWMSGSPGGGPQGEAAQIADTVTHLRDIITKAADGTHVLQKDQNGVWQAVTYSDLTASTGGAFVVVPVKSSTTLLTPQPTPGRSEGQQDPTDPNFGLIPKADRQSITVSYGQVYGVKPIIARAPAAAIDPATGRELGAGPDPIGDQNIGMVSYLPDGDGQLTVPVYGIYSQSGQMRWSTENPFKPGSTTSTVSQTVNGQDSLVVTGDPTRAGALTYYIKQADGSIKPQLAPPTTGQEVAEVRFNQQSIIDTFQTRSANATTFMDPGLAYVASQPSGRQEIASWSPQEVYHSFNGSPWINWQDPNATSEFWGDIGAVKASEAAKNSANPYMSRLSSEWTFYNAVQQQRSGDLAANNGWVKSITQMQIGGLVGSEAADRAAAGIGVGTDYTGRNTLTRPPALPTSGFDPTKTTAYQQWLDKVNQVPLGARGPFPAPPIPNTPYTKYDPYSGSQYYSPLTPQNYAQQYGVQPGGGPTITNNGNIKLPSLPGQTPNAGGEFGPRNPDRPFAPSNAPSPRYTPPTATAPPGALPPFLPPAPNPNQPNIPGVSPRPRIPHEWDPFGPVGH